MISRMLAEELKKSAKEYRVVTLIGPRQAGKSTLSRHTFPDYQQVSLEDPDLRHVAETDPRAFLRTYEKFVIIDEIQRVPSLLSYIQTVVDDEPIKGRYILTGSHQLELREAISQSLAGRTAVLTLLPLSMEEIRVADIFQQILLGMMPALNAEGLRPISYFRNYYQTYLERDVRRMINLKDSVQFERFVQLTAGRAGSIVNYSSLANDVGVSINTIKDWLAILEASFIVFRLPPYFENFGKRVIKSPKLYFVDSGLLCWLLGIETKEALQRDRMRGNIFENFIVAEALKARLNRGRDPRLYFYRDSQGNEVDLVVESGRSLKAIEIKSSETWNSEFRKSLDMLYHIVGDRLISREVIFAGERSMKLTDCTVTSAHQLDPSQFL